MKPHRKHSVSAAFAFILAASSPVMSATVYIDSFNQGYSGGHDATLDSSTGGSTQTSVTQTLTVGTPTDAIGTVRTLSTDVSSTVSFVGNERVTTEALNLGSELRLVNSLIADNPAPPDHTTHKVIWTGISGANQQLMSNVGTASLADLSFVVRVSAASNRDSSYTANQVFDMTLFSGSDTAGFRGIMTDAEFTSGDDIFVTLNLFGPPDPSFDPNAVDKIVFQTSLAFTQGADLGGGTPLENAVLIKQITAIPEASSAMLALAAVGYLAIRRRR